MGLKGVAHIYKRCEGKIFHLGDYVHKKSNDAADVTQLAKNNMELRVLIKFYGKDSGGGPPGPGNFDHFTGYRFGPTNGPQMALGASGRAPGLGPRARAPGPGPRPRAPGPGRRAPGARVTDGSRPSGAK